jgi:hypothetical protein
MPQNFRLQKENGIFIKTFYGHDTEDTALYDLANILISKIRIIFSNCGKQIKGCESVVTKIQRRNSEENNVKYI